MKRLLWVSVMALALALAALNVWRYLNGESVIAWRAVQHHPTWPQEPTGFRMPFGTSKEALARSFSVSRETRAGLSACDDRRFPNACFTQAVIAPNVISDEVYRFDDDALAQVVVTFDSSDYEVVKEVFIERYGSPMSRTSGGTLSWTGSTVTVTLRRYNKDMKSIAVISTKAFAEKRRRERDARLKAAATKF